MLSVNADNAYLPALTVQTEKMMSWSQFRPFPLARMLSLGISAAFAGSLLTPPAHASGTSNDNLTGVVEEALNTSPEIGFQIDRFRASVEDRRQVWGGYLPSVDLDAAIGQGNREFDGRGNYTREYAELSVTQLLFDGFGLQSRLSQADHEMRARYYEALDQAEQTTLEVVEAYLDVRRYRELVALARANVESHQDVRAKVQRRADSGVGTAADLNQIDGRLALARSNLMTEIRNLQSVTARFERLVGRTPADRLSPVNKLAMTDELDLAGVVENTFANNPTLYAAFEQIKQARASLRETRSARYPTLELGVHQGIYRNQNSFDERYDPSDRGNDFRVELRMRYNLFRGGSDRAAERAANHRIDQARNLRDKTCVDLRQTATIAYTNRENLKHTQAQLIAHRDASAEALRAYRQQFDIGRRSLLDVLDSENELFQSNRAVVNGQYNERLATARTLSSMGRLLESLADRDERLPTIDSAFADSPSAGAGQYCSAMMEAGIELPSFNR